MDFDVFFNKLVKECASLNVCISEGQAKSFFKYMNLLIEWNEKMNLTTIVEPDDIIIKHFIDSLTISKFIDRGAKVADIGTGAGFPGLPISLVHEDCEFSLVDSLNKRIVFLQEVINNIGIKNVSTIHSRAEDFGKDKNFRESYDIVVSRAVASLNVLVEYMLPVLKMGGFCICMKAFNIDEEVKNAKKACELLGGSIDFIDEVTLPNTDIIRKNIVVRKIKDTPNRFPRKAGIPSKEPLV